MSPVNEEEALRELMKGSTKNEEIGATYVDPPHSLNKNQALIGVIVVALLFMMTIIPQQRNPTGYVISEGGAEQRVPEQSISSEATETPSADLITGAVVATPQGSEPLFPKDQIPTLKEIYKAEHLIVYESEIETSQVYALSPENTAIIPYIIGKASQYFYLKPLKMEKKKEFIATFTFTTDFILDQTDTIEMLFLFYNQAGTIIQTKNFVYVNGNIIDEELVTGVITKESKRAQIDGKEQIILHIEITPDIQVNTLSVAFIPRKEGTKQVIRGNIILYEANMHEV